MEVNYFASLRMAEMARKSESGVCFSSSCSIYGGSGDEMLDETRRFSRSLCTPGPKFFWRTNCRRWPDSFGPVYSAMPRLTALPGLRLDLVLNDLVASAVLNGRILIKSDGTPWRPIVHIEDISRAFRGLPERPRRRNFKQAFNVGSTTKTIGSATSRRSSPKPCPTAPSNMPPAADLTNAATASTATRSALRCLNSGRTGPPAAAPGTVRSISANRLRADQIPIFSRLAEIRSQIAAGRLNEDLSACRIAASVS